MRRLRIILLLALAAGWVVPTADGATARKPARPDLSVSAGRITLSNGVLRGSFTVKDSRASAKRSAAALVITVNGRKRTLGAFSVPKLKKGRSFKVKVAKKVAAVPAGTYRLLACADHRGALKEKSEKNNCRRVGTLVVPASGTPTSPVPPTGTPPTGTPTPTTPSSFPSAPDTTYTADTAFQQDGRYWIDVPSSYDRSHATPAELFVWLHGCGGASQDDVNTVADTSPAVDYIAIAPLGAEGSCWDMTSGQQYVLDAIAAVKTHFNINPRKVILGGYSSGGDLTYRTAFYHATTFAGVLVMNSSPFRDTGSTASQSLAAAAWKFNIVHVLHTNDATYPTADVLSELDQVKAAGFPVTRIQLAGTHYDPPTYAPDGTTLTGGTDYDIQHTLLPYLNNDWLSPAG